MTAALFCAALRKDRLLARECSFSAWVIHEGARRSRISRSAERDQGAALDLRFFEKNRVKLYLCNLSISVAFIDRLQPLRDALMRMLQIVEKVVCNKKLHKGGKVYARWERAWLCLIRILRLYIAFRKRKAARTQAFLRVSEPSLRLLAMGSARLRPKAVSD